MDSMADSVQLVLLGQIDFGTVQLIAFSYFDLSLHNVDAGDLFSNGVLNLNARVNLDEIEFTIGSS